MRKIIIIPLLMIILKRPPFNKYIGNTKSLSIKVNDRYYNLSYKLINDESNDIYILFNGITRGMYVWNNIINSLKDKGGSILVFDYFGRGLSDYIDIEYTEEFYTTTIKYMLAKILPNNTKNHKIHLIGYSLGCSIITALLYTNSILNLVSVTYISPTGFMKPPKWKSLLLSLPFRLLFNIMYISRDIKYIYGKQEDFNNRIDKLIWMDPNEQLNYKTQYSVDRNSKEQLKAVLLTAKEGWFINNEHKYRSILHNYNYVTFKVFYGIDDKVIVKEDIEKRMKHALSSYTNITYIKVTGTVNLPADHEMFISYSQYIINNL